MNSIRSKFDNLKAIIHDYVHILCVSKTKIDKSFPTAQCHRPYHLDISDRWGGLLFYIKFHYLLNANKSYYGKGYSNYTVWIKSKERKVNVYVYL